MKELPIYKELWEESIKDFKDIYWCRSLRRRWQLDSDDPSIISKVFWCVRQTFWVLASTVSPEHLVITFSFSLNPGATDKPRNAQEKSKLHSEWAQPVTPETRDVENQGIKWGERRGGEMWPTHPPLSLFCISQHLEPKLFQDLNLFGDINKGLFRKWAWSWSLTDEMGLGSAGTARTKKPRRFKKHKEGQCG